MDLRDLASVPLRFGLGIMFLFHGLQKAFGLFGGSGIQKFSDMLMGLGFPNTMFWAYFVAYLEITGGILLIVGLLTRFSAFALAVLMVVAAVKVHLPNGFSFMKGGFEYNFIIVCACLALSLLGGGEFSMNRDL